MPDFYDEAVRDYLESLFSDERHVLVIRRIDAQGRVVEETRDYRDERYHRAKEPDDRA